MNLKILLFTLVITIASLYADPVTFHNNTNTHVHCFGVSQGNLIGFIMNPQSTARPLVSAGNWQLTCFNDLVQGLYNGPLSVQDEISISESPDNTALIIEHAGGFSNE